MKALLQCTTAEIQGDYGAFSFPEKLLQKIWLRGDFNRSLARTADGRAVQILHPGTWNLLGGPDFLRARFVIEGERERVADIEVHLRAADWESHGHADDPAYDQVGLHVVLFPPAPGKVTLGSGDRSIPVLALLPLLHHDLEEFALEDAVEQLSNRPTARILEALGTLPREALVGRLLRESRARWEQKVRFARLRIQRLGWRMACHSTALEILGYRFNRAPMLRIAGRWPIPAWTSEAFDHEIPYAFEGNGWSLQGVRPLNHPKRRLAQYAVWIKQVPAWPELLEEVGLVWPDAEVQLTTREVRSRWQFSTLRDELAGRVCGGAVGGCRVDNLICDGFLPLLAARQVLSGYGYWHHWFPGDLPPFLHVGLRQVGLAGDRVQPCCHGLAQGLLGWALGRGERI